MIQYGILPLFLVREESDGPQFAGRSREISVGMQPQQTKGRKR